MFPFGLLGRKLGHSRSPEIHAALADYKYRLFEVEPENLGEFIKAREFSGLNVTVPYKKAVIEYLDDLTERARAIGGVNTVLIRGGRLIGDNTDAAGFEYMLKRACVDPNGKKAIVLGSGGASAAIIYVLRRIGASEVVTVSRTGENNYENILRHGDADIIVNTTPVGMWPDCFSSPLDKARSLDVSSPFESFDNLSAVLDIVYNPLRTKLMLDAEKAGVPTCGGLYMLVEQAAEASRLFLGDNLNSNYTSRTGNNDAVIEGIVSKISSDMSNIVLIGMPGCGKTSVGRALAKTTGKDFIDSDAVIVDRTGKSIPEIFADGGEEEFRRIESDVLADITQTPGRVIATGGGCVTRSVNYDSLRRFGKVVYIERPIDRLETDGRPLSQGADLEKMLADRRELYERFADVTVKNDKTVKKCVVKIISVLGLDAGMDLEVNESASAYFAENIREEK